MHCYSLTLTKQIQTALATVLPLLNIPEREIVSLGNQIVSFGVLIVRQANKRDAQTCFSIILLLFVCRSIDMLYCWYTPGTAPLHPISVMVLVEFSFSYAGHLCIAGPQKFCSSVSVRIREVLHLIEYVQHGLEWPFNSRNYTHFKCVCAHTFTLRFV